MGNTSVQIDGKTLKIDDKGYQLTPGLIALITQKHPRHVQYNGNDYNVYKSLVAQTKINHLRIG